MRNKNPRILVLEAVKLQSSSNSSKKALLKAKNCLLQALKSDKEYLPALIELGYFHGYVLDDSFNSIRYFEKAESILLLNYSEIGIGKSQALIDLGKKKKAISYLKKLISIFPKQSEANICLQKKLEEIIEN